LKDVDFKEIYYTNEQGNFCKAWIF
jgi:hypothetical protein